MSILNEKIRELTAISASVAANCLPCLSYHFGEAVKQGCTEDEIKQAIEIANMVKKRPALDINKLSLKLFEELKSEKVKEETR
ncbi:MAG: carboxymuconolactone decarboxylase family protein [Spirochaetota bacterium]